MPRAVTAVLPDPAAWMPVSAGDGAKVAVTVSVRSPSSDSRGITSIWHLADDVAPTSVHVAGWRSEARSVLVKRTVPAGADAVAGDASTTVAVHTARRWRTVVLDGAQDSCTTVARRTMATVAAPRPSRACRRGSRRSPARRRPGLWGSSSGSRATYGR